MPKQAPSHATVVCIRGSLFGVHCFDLFFHKTLLFQNFVVMQLNFKAQTEYSATLRLVTNQGFKSSLELHTTVARKGALEPLTTVARKGAFELYCTDFRYFAGVVPLICLKVLIK